MATTIPVKKSKISLGDYSYQRDIENRVLMANFTVFEVQVLEEILSGSLQTTTSLLAQSFEITPQELQPVLDSLSKTRLFVRRGEVILIDKEMRKYYESQIVKFNDEFETGMEFLKGLLKKVPIDVLPGWYSLPRTIDDIFLSVIEKYFLTPKIYQRYLSELNFDDPVLAGIMNDVFSSPELKVRSKQLREKYSLTREQFEEYMLTLEYNFVCCLRYTQIDDAWKEIVTPFHEWREYLLFLKKNIPTTLPEKQVKAKDKGSFGFLNDLEILTKEILERPFSVEKIPSIIKYMPTLYSTLSYKGVQCYVQQLIDKLLMLKLAKMEDQMLVALESSKSWLELSKEKQALQLYRFTTMQFRQISVSAFLYTDKNIREVEKSMKRIAKMGWITFDEYLKGLLAPIGQASEVALKKTGKQWKYTIPSYTDEEKTFIKATIFERLWEMGMINMGTFEGAECFCLTPFGQATLAHD